MRHHALRSLLTKEQHSLLYWETQHTRHSSRTTHHPLLTTAAHTTSRSLTHITSDHLFRGSPPLSTPVHPSRDFLGHHPYNRLSAPHLSSITFHARSHGDIGLFCHFSLTWTIILGSLGTTNKYTHILITAGLRSTLVLFDEEYSSVISTLGRYGLLFRPTPHCVWCAILLTSTHSDSNFSV